MRFWSLDLAVDQAIYHVDLRKKAYQFVRRNPRWKEMPAAQNARNRRQLHGPNRVFRDGSTRVFVDATWPYGEHSPCPTCYTWIPRDSPCDHEQYECPTCGRRQCLRHWRYPMRTQREAVHFLKAAETQTGKRCFVREVGRPLRTGRNAPQWKVFTSTADYESYLATGKHSR